MLSYLKNLMTDETKFVGFARAALLGLAAAAGADQVPLPPEFAWIPAVIGGMIRSSSATVESTNQS